MAIKGSLKEASLADVCQLLAMGQKTGCLSVTDRSRFGQIYFDRGKITYARIVNRRDRLGDLLVREGVLNQQQLLEVLEQQSREPDKRVGELLIERGFLSQKDLHRYIRHQIEEAVYHLFTWSRGSFYFEVDELPDANDMLVSINPESLLLEAARRVDEWSLVEKKIQSLDLLFEVERERLDSANVELTHEQQQILPLLDGTRSVQEIIDESGLGEFDTGKAVFGLIQAGFAHRVGKRAETEAAARMRGSDVTERRNLGFAFYRTGMLDDARREFNRVIEVDSHDFVSRFHIALIALREGDNRQAIRLFKALVTDFGPRFGAFYNLALALRGLGRFEEALLVLDEAERMRGDHRIWLLRGALHTDAGDAESALNSLDEYRSRLQNDAKLPALYFYQTALAAALKRDINRAETVLTEGLQRYASSAQLLTLLGAVSERRGDLDSAERHYRQATEEMPTLAQAHKDLGDVAYRRGLHDEALEHYTRTIQLSPTIGDDVYSKLGNLYYKRMRRDDAVRYWRQALELNPSNQVVRNNLDIIGNAG